MVTTLFGSLWILLAAVLLLAPPFDPAVKMGDFVPDTMYEGKLNPLQDNSIQVDDIYFPSHGDKCHAWLYTKAIEISVEEESQVKPHQPIVVMAPGFGTDKNE